MERNKFFFQEWSFIAKVDPETFESRRRRTLGDALQQLGSLREHGERLQAEIDAARIRSEDPERAILVAISQLNHRLSSLDDDLTALAEELKVSPGNS